MLKIGVSACFLHPDPSRLEYGNSQLFFIESEMSTYLSREGVIPILLPNLPWRELEQILNIVDGLVLQGGADISPQAYGENPLKPEWSGDAHRDQYEISILNYIFHKKIPCLGICRGFQLLNVFFGGNLYQDLRTQFESSVIHEDKTLIEKVNHQLRVEKSGLIYPLYEEDNLCVNSLHHQGVKNLGRDLVVDAISLNDQLVEAFHHKDLNQNLLMGVQWHPEFKENLGGKITKGKPIYDYFLEEVKKRKNI